MFALAIKRAIVLAVYVAVLKFSMSNEQRREVLRLIAGRKQRIEQLKDQQLGFDFEEVLEVGDLF